MGSLPYGCGGVQQQTGLTARDPARTKEHATNKKKPKCRPASALGNADLGRNEHGTWCFCALRNLRSYICYKFAHHLIYASF
ncbi:unnamed protein product [Pieris brassicae]|uniref:Uncharacterized protein n=1 Tax=Pieris brassicae TaxID=7116 RepID=A0A9P0TT65_PIEBR|nr:unnamed protein product [Pieris brassicae]